MFSIIQNRLQIRMTGAIPGLLLLLFVSGSLTDAQVPRTEPGARTLAKKQPQPTQKKSPAVETDSSVIMLQRYGVASDQKSLRKYLKSMLPDSDAQKSQARLIRQLGHDDYHKREAAMKALLKMPVISAELLQEAVAGPDAEIRWRAGRILLTANRRSSEILYAVYSVIAKKKLTGMVSEILLTMPLCSEELLIQAADRALEASATRDDAKLLSSRLDDKSKPIRLAVIRAYSQALGNEADAELNRLLKDQDDVIKAEAARGLLTHSNREALPVLVQLLSSADLKTRVRAVKYLRAASGKRYGFMAYETPNNRKSATLKWREWVAGNGQTAKLKLPLRETAVEVGRTIICNYSRNRVIELDSHGKKIWEHPVGTHPWACQGLSNGHRIVACYSTRTVTEYDGKGKIVWAKTSLPGGPTGVQRLENGNTLVALTDSHQVIEYNRSGTAVWQSRITQRPTDAHRLDNGRTLVTLQNGGRVVEIDRAGKVVFSITGLSSPFSAQRLDNGHTLVACVGNGSVLEYDATGKKVVWLKTGLRSPYCAQRLANGNTLVSDQSGLREFDRAGKVKWTYSLSGVSKFHRY